MKTALSIAELRERHGLDTVVLACGVFDGVHRGHRRILDAVLDLARRTGAAPVVVTFDPHPRSVVLPGQAPKLLTVKEQKVRLFAELGMAATVFLPFSRAMASLAPEAFVQQHLLGSGVRVRGVCVGAQWRFGAGGRGDTVLLQRLGRENGFAVRSVPEFCLYGKPVSSTRIRNALTAGRLRFARQLLGRPYTVFGRVSHGKGVGEKEFRCPTANVLGRNIILPRFGVYAARGWLSGHPRVRRDGIVYVGTAPTLRDGAEAGPAQPILELHLFDFHDDIYGRTVEIEFLDFIRPDQVFASHAALRRQIGADLVTAREILSRG
ncbi:MAG: riboflavin biosynthesis protein RibF [Lentisphaerae bacterium RIFOXYB12_FULL_65_16]|nr:MAG: riboflavin biosynthesis protein RibF [Lentisphaerae bacterium RIFOXYA12_64_32]OGV87707.1 MAG: riboflavin biosynthesis protein RibF [Lentisphaerae bacterium RIFOXYB12_FULL_65_16]